MLRHGRELRRRRSEESDLFVEEGGKREGRILERGFKEAEFGGYEYFLSGFGDREIGVYYCREVGNG